MINLACREPSIKHSDEATLQCIAELVEAGIAVEISPTTPIGEVSSRATGKLGPFKFERAWRYWICKGPMPLDLANQIYGATLGPRPGSQDKPVKAGKVIRVAGHCMAPKPEDWAENYAADGRKFLRDTPEQRASCEQFKHIIERTGKMEDRFVWSKDPVEEATRSGYRIIDQYHVDTQEGLNFLAEKIRSWPNKGPAVQLA